MAVVSKIETTDGVRHNIAASELTYTNYGVCSSSASTVSKTVTVDNENFSLSVGVKVNVKFNSSNTAESPTLAVNGTAAKPIVTKGANGVGRGATSSWNGGSVVELTYDGTSWVIDGWLNNNDVYHAGGSNVTVEDLDPFEEYDSLNTIYNSSSTSFSTALIPANQNEVFIDIRYYEQSTLTNFYLFGFVGGANANYRYGIVQPTNTSSAKFHLCWRDKDNAYLESTVARVASHLYRIKARLHNGTATLYVLDETTGVSDTVTATYDTTNVNTLASYIRLFAGGSSNYYCGSGTYVYSAKMDCDGKPMLNYIPMRRKSDEMVGFLDTVSDSFLSSDSGNVPANKLNVGSLIDRPDNHIIKVSSTVDDSNFVHKTGAETVGGEKTFTDNLKIASGAVIDLGVGNDEGVYIQASSDSNGKQIAFGDDGDDSEVRLVNVAAPIDGLDAANKAYVDAAIEGGSSGITLPLAIDQGGTGRTTARGAEYEVTPKLATELSTDIEDSYRIPFLTSSASATNGRFAGWRRTSRFWDYILGKITSFLGISYNSNDEGVPLAPTAASGTNNTQIATTAFVQNATSGFASDSSVVHKAGAEDITGDKTFKGADIILQNTGTSSASTPNLVFQRGTSTDGYIDWVVGNNSSGQLVVSSRSSSTTTERFRFVGSSSTQQVVSSIDVKAPKFITDGGSAQQYVKGDGTLGGNATQSVAGLLSATDKTKLDGIAVGAEVNVQSDWNQTDNTADNFIKNKPTIATYDVFTYGSDATPGEPGNNGLVPAPTFGERTKVLRGDRSWVSLPSASSAAPSMDGVASVGTSTSYSRGDHVHPTDTSRAADNAVVHRSGAETVSGAKTFTNNLTLSGTATLNFETSQDAGIYVEAFEDTNNVKELNFCDIEDDSQVRLTNVATPVQSTDAVNKAYVDNLSKNGVVNLNGYSGSYGIHQRSLCAFALSAGGATMTMTSFTTTGGSSSKSPITGLVFPIGCKIYYHGETEAFAATTSFTSKEFYATHNSVNARYSAVTGSSISLGSSSASTVYLRVMVANGYWSPYYKQGAVTENVVSSDNLVSGGFYIYLGKTSGSNSYDFQLEDNNPLYYYDGTKLVDWSTYIAQQNAGATYVGGAGINISGNVISTAQKAWSTELNNVSFNSQRTTSLNPSSPNQMSAVGLYKISAMFTLGTGNTGDYATEAQVLLQVTANGYVEPITLVNTYISLPQVRNVATNVPCYFEGYVYLSSGNLIPSLTIKPNGYVWSNSASDNPTNGRLTAQYIGVENIINV